MESTIESQPFGLTRTECSVLGFAAGLVFALVAVGASLVL